MRRAACACRKPGCPGLVRDGTCSVCGLLRAQASRVHDERRGSASSRGYDRRWQRIRAVQLRSHPLCEDCAQGQRVVAASEVHHIVALRDGGTHEASNLLSLCKSCHSSRTAKGE